MDKRDFVFTVTARQDRETERYYGVIYLGVAIMWIDDDRYHSSQYALDIAQGHLQHKIAGLLNTNEYVILDSMS